MLASTLSLVINDVTVHAGHRSQSVVLEIQLGPAILRRAVFKEWLKKGTQTGLFGSYRDRGGLILI